MTGLHLADDTLHCDGVPLPAIAAEVGTPVYVYSAPVIRERCHAFARAFGDYPHTLHYALKANSTLAVVRLIRGLGCGVDANSGGEIEVALRAGFIPPQIVFTGVGKTRAELERAIGIGVKTINAESANEVRRIADLTRGLGITTTVALRINPDIDARSHPHISTGHRSAKFGVPIEDAPAIFREAAGWPGVALTGIHCHVGSQITSLDPIRRVARAAARLAGELQQDGLTIDHLDLGGGLGISYDGTAVPSVDDYAAAILDEVRPLGVPLVLEPGRAILGPAGALIAEVVDRKAQSGQRVVVVLDSGMTELLRPAMYGSFHRIVPVRPNGREPATCDLVGPLCESSDVFGVDRLMPPLDVGDLVAVLDAGAYGIVMASNYNRRPLPPEVLVDGDAWRLIRRRQTVDDMLQWEE